MRAANSACFDRAHREPVDRVAARVVARGTRFEKANRDPDARRWTEQPPIRRTPADTPQLQGQRFGRFTVIGFSRDHAKRWVCRCSCGMFELRTSRSIRNPENHGDRCYDCRHVAYLRRKHIRETTGREVDVRTM